MEILKIVFGLSLSKEFVNGRAFESLVRKENSSWKMGMIGRVGKVLSFQAKTGSIYIVSGKELDSRLIGIHFKDPSRPGVFNPGSKLAEVAS